MQRRRKLKWEYIMIDLAAIFFWVCVTSAGWTGAKTKNVQAQEPSITQAAEPQVTQGIPVETQYVGQMVTSATPYNKDALIASRDWGEEDVNILLRIAMAEAEGEDTEGKALVMLVILNRVWSDGFPDTVEDVVFQTLDGDYQFSPVVPGGRYWTEEPNEDCKMALRMIEDGWDESQGALYFEASNPNTSWQKENCEFLFEHGNHTFYK